MACKTCVFYALLLLLAQDNIVALGRQHNAKKSHSEPELKRIKVNTDAKQYVPTGISNTTERVESRISVFEMAGMSAYGILKEFSKSCIYGRYCGSACHAKKGDRRTRGLDGACYKHDRCLDNPRMAYAEYECPYVGKAGTDLKCTCEKRLASAAWKIYKKGKKCSWWNVLCIESKEVAAAWAVGNAMDYRKYCGDC